MATVSLNSCVKSLRTPLTHTHTHTHTHSLAGTRRAHSTGHWLVLSRVLFKPARLLHFQKQVLDWKLTSKRHVIQSVTKEAESEYAQARRQNNMHSPLPEDQS
ncbi:hypothetical protein QQF64_014894 [Cirrhinus molitorella]|uniref:Uncharacterized protein n=1 Tax=Cirrhinus molitorella TaxID=172907 RepID=A0ABR3NTP0_9TELE